MQNKTFVQTMDSKNIRPAILKIASLLILLAVWQIAYAQLDANEDDDFIILDDRGEGAELEEDDVPLSGRKPRKPISSEGAPGGKQDGTASSGDDAQPEVAPPKRFEPTERVSEDLSVSFPADI